MRKFINFLLICGIALFISTYGNKTESIAAIKSPVPTIIIEEIKEIELSVIDPIIEQVTRHKTNVKVEIKKIGYTGSHFNNESQGSLQSSLRELTCFYHSYNSAQKILATIIVNDIKLQLTIMYLIDEDYASSPCGRIFDDSIDHRNHDHDCQHKAYAKLMVECTEGILEYKNNFNIYNASENDYLTEDFYKNTSLEKLILAILPAIKTQNEEIELREMKKQERLEENAKRKEKRNEEIRKRAFEKIKENIINSLK